MTMERTTHKAQRPLELVQPCFDTYGVKLASRIAFGNQTIFLPSRWTKVERLSALRPYLTAGLPFRCV